MAAKRVQDFFYKVKHTQGPVSQEAAASMEALVATSAPVRDPYHHSHLHV